MHFLLPTQLSPTYANLSTHLKALNWKPTRFQWRADFSAQHFQFDAAVTETLEFKHQLANLINEYCPDVMPLTFAIDDQNFPTVLAQLKTTPPAIWILKPALLNNGQHIQIFQHTAEVEAYYQTTARLGGPHVLQHYVNNPQLLKGHKYSIRLFIVLNNNAGAFIYPAGYFNVAKTMYEPNDFFDLGPHLTNEHLMAEEANVYQIPSALFDFFPESYVQIKAMISQVMRGLQQRFPAAFNLHEKRRLAIFGFDFMLDEDLRPWLLEANHGPCFPVNPQHPLQEHLYTFFWRDFIKSFVWPIANKIPLENIEYSSFEKL